MKKSPRYLTFITIGYFVLLAVLCSSVTRSAPSRFGVIGGAVVGEQNAQDGTTYISGYHFKCQNTNICQATIAENELIIQIQDRSHCTAEYNNTSLECRMGLYDFNKPNHAFVHGSLGLNEQEIRTLQWQYFFGNSVRRNNGLFTIIISTLTAALIAFNVYMSASRKQSHWRALLFSSIGSGLVTWIISSSIWLMVFISLFE